MKRKNIQKALLNKLNMGEKISIDEAYNLFSKNRKENGRNNQGRFADH